MMSAETTIAAYPRALAHLRAEPNVAADRAMAQAMPHMVPSAQSTALALLLERGHDASLARVVANFARLDGKLQSTVVARIRDLSGAVRLAIGSEEFEDRAATIELITRCRNGHLTYLLAEGLRTRCVKTRQLAAGAIKQLTEELLAESSKGRPSENRAASNALADGLTHALERSVATWEIHLQPEVLEAALWMGDRLEQALRKKLAERQTKLARALNHVLKGVSDPRLAGFAVRALAVPALRAAAAQAIGQARDPAFVRALLGSCWLLADESIERGCRWIQATQWLDAIRDDLSSLRADHASGAVRLLAASGGSAEAKMERFRELALLDSPELRHAVIGQLVQIEADCATDLLRALAARFRDDAGRFALRELRRRRADGDAKSDNVAVSPEDSAAVRAWRAFERYWEEYDELDDEDRSALTEAMRPLADHLLVPLRAKLASAKPRERARTLQLAHAFGVTRALAEQVYRHAHDPDAVVRSLAVAMLADLPGPTSLRILRAVVTDPDARVQANAIEALERLNASDRVDCTAPQLDSKNARVRANAIKSLLRLNVPQAAEELLTMLADPQSNHRLSALWVVERLRLKAMVRRIVDLGSHDPDEKVRRRAGRVLRALPDQDPQQSSPVRHVTRAPVGDVP